ncbi:MAG: nitroreductase family protein [Actinomycetota bacterium]
MELTTALARRRMVRRFDPAPLPRSDLDELLDRARRAPSAGNTQAAGFVVLDEPAQTARYWDLTLPSERRRGFRWQGLLVAPALVIVTTRPQAYLDRYAESDKAASGRGGDADRWPVPYWWVDAGAVAQNVLLLAVDRGWGACLFGPFDHEPALRREFGLDEDVRLVATIAVGRPLPDEPGRSSSRPRPPLDQVIHRPAPRS